MVEYSKKLVRCNFCFGVFPKEKDTNYKNPTPCPKCKKGHLWLLDMEVDEEQLKKDKYNREHPTHSENVKNAIHKSDRDMPDRAPNFGTRLGKGFEMLDGECDE